MLISYAAGGFFAWIAGQWVMRTVDPLDIWWPVGSLLSTLGVISMAAAIFWAARMTIAASGELPFSAPE